MERSAAAKMSKFCHKTKIPGSAIQPRTLWPCVDQLRERPAEEKEETVNFYRRMLRGAARFSEVFVEVVDYIYLNHQGGICGG